MSKEEPTQKEVFLALVESVRYGMEKAAVRDMEKKKKEKNK